MGTIGTIGSQASVYEKGVKLPTIKMRNSLQVPLDIFRSFE